MRTIRAKGTRQRERGVVLLLTTLFLLFVALPAIGLAIDAGVGFAAKARLQTAVDGAALAGARSLSRGRSLAEQQGSAENTARAFFAANMHEAWSPMSNLQVGVSWPPAPPKTAVIRVEATADAPTYFLKYLGYSRLGLKAVGVANRREGASRHAPARHEQGFRPGTVFEQLARRRRRRHKREPNPG